MLQAVTSQFDSPQLFGRGRAKIMQMRQPSFSLIINGLKTIFGMRTLVLYLALINVVEAYPQDYIITRGGDTLHCRLPGHIRKEGIRPVYKYLNGHIRLAVVFPNDSLRVHEPGQIRGYYRAEHGKSLLCDGYFESRKMAWKAGDTSWFFMNRVYEGPFATLFKIYISDGDAPSLNYFLAKKGQSDGDFVHLVAGRKKLKKMLTDPDTQEAMEALFSRRKKISYRDAVVAYNQLKTGQRSASPAP